MITTEIENKVIPIKFGHVNIYLVKYENGYILVDTGMPNKNEQFDDVFLKYGVDPTSIQLIILTHGHLDHVGSVAYLQEFTGGKILCHRSYANALGAGRIEPAVAQKFSGQILNFLSGFLGSKIGCVKADIIVDEEYDLGEYGLSGKVIHTPGHSASSLSILLASGEVLVGDLIREDGSGEVGLGMFYEDKDAVFESLKKIAAFNPRIIFLSHGTTIDNSVLQDFLDAHI